jgi:hypothetical protein
MPGAYVVDEFLWNPNTVTRNVVVQILGPQPHSIALEIGLRKRGSTNPARPFQACRGNYYKRIRNVSQKPVLVRWIPIKIDPVS